ncbi:MAG: hypothetical protein ACOYIK_11495 [Coriobacteriales bacterium]|jgi:hypothetical protein
MKPLKHATALASYATSALVFVPSAFAAGESGAASAATSIAEPVSLAIVSAVAVCGYVGWVKKSNDYRRLDEEYCRYKMQMGFAGRDDGMEEGIDSVDQLKSQPSHSRVEWSSDAYSRRHLDKVPASSSESSTAKTDDSPSDSAIFGAAAHRNILNNIVPFVDEVGDGDERALFGYQPENGNNETTEIPALDENGNSEGQKEEVVSGPVEYVPRHLKKSEAVTDQKVDIDSSDMISALENNFGNILDSSEEADESASEVVSSDGDEDQVPAVELDEVGEGYRINAEPIEKVSARLDRQKLHNRFEDDVSDAGRRSQLATAAAAMAAKAIGNHAAQLSASAESESKPYIPIKRGPGFVDVNDSTFVKEGSNAVSKAANLDGKVPSVAGGRYVSSTDSISNFPYSEVRKTYYTQGEMVPVQYPRESFENTNRPSDSEEEKLPSDKSIAARVALLTTLPIV